MPRPVPGRQSRRRPPGAAAAPWVAWPSITGRGTRAKPKATTRGRGSALGGLAEHHRPGRGPKPKATTRGRGSALGGLAEHHRPGDAGQAEGDHQGPRQRLLGGLAEHHRPGDAGKAEGDHQGPRQRPGWPGRASPPGGRGQSRRRPPGAAAAPPGWPGRASPPGGRGQSRRRPGRITRLYSNSAPAASCRRGRASRASGECRKARGVSWRREPQASCQAPYRRGRQRPHRQAARPGRPARGPGAHGPAGVPSNGFSPQMPSETSSVTVLPIRPRRGQGGAYTPRRGAQGRGYEHAERPERGAVASVEPMPSQDASDPLGRTTAAGDRLWRFLTRAGRREDQRIAGNWPARSGPILPVNLHPVRGRRARRDRVTTEPTQAATRRMLNTSAAGAQPMSRVRFTILARFPLTFLILIHHLVPTSTSRYCSSSFDPHST